MAIDYDDAADIMRKLMQMHEDILDIRQLLEDDDDAPEEDDDP